MLLLASRFFYMFFVPYCIIILVVTIIDDYLAGLLIEKTPIRARRNSSCS
jgi:alginate O-acetyltransferase complex protein AlgI